MKKLTLFTTLSILLCITSCTKEEGCTDQTATNYNAEAEKDDSSCIHYSDLIIGTWNGKTIEVSVELSEEMTQAFITSAQMMSPEDFEFEYGVAKPTTNEGWLNLVQNITTETIDITDMTIVFTETTMSISEDGDTESINCIISNDRITIVDEDGTLDEFDGLTHFDIATCTETDLVVTSQLNVLEIPDLQNIDITATMTVTCTR
ncbi:MAG: hypothetical protein NZ604_00980 [Flavobacteriales bacterium]|nr:hypothetical protein [Flavobacteriales bacterium]